MYLDGGGGGGGGSPPPPVPYLSETEFVFYLVAFIILILVSMINALVPEDASWAFKLFSIIATYGAANFFMTFALFATGAMTEAAMLSSLVGFFCVILGAIIDTFWASSDFERTCMFIVFGAGFILTFIEIFASGGIFVAAKYCLMAVAFIALGLAYYFDWLDSDGIVG